MENKSKLYGAVNKMSGIKFGFNVSLLRYLENEGQFLLEGKYTKSEQLQINTQLDVAKIYSNIPIYIPLQVDWRGRIYTQSSYANYQGSDLSLSLIEF